METNKSIAIVGENNLPELIQDKFGNTRMLAENANRLSKAATVSSEELGKALNKMHRLNEASKIL